MRYIIPIVVAGMALLALAAAPVVFADNTASPGNQDTSISITHVYDGTAFVTYTDGMTINTDTPKFRGTSTGYDSVTLQVRSSDGTVTQIGTGTGVTDDGGFQRGRTMLADDTYTIIVGSVSLGTITIDTGIDDNVPEALFSPAIATSDSTLAVTSVYYDTDGLLLVRFNEQFNPDTINYTAVKLSGQSNVTLNSVTTKSHNNNADVIWAVLDKTQQGGVGTQSLTLEIEADSIYDTNGNAMAQTSMPVSVTTLGTQIDQTKPISLVANDLSDDRSLRGAYGVDIFSVSGSTYAVVAAIGDHGIQIVNLTDPANPTAAGNLVDSNSTTLDGASIVDIYSASGSTYAVVTSLGDHGIQIVNIADPANPTAAGNLVDDDSTALAGAFGVNIFSASGSTYAVVTSLGDDGVQIVDVTDPANPTAAGNLVDTASTTLAGASSVDIFSARGSTYAVVTAASDNGIQIVDVTDPNTLLPVGMINGGDALGWTSGIAVFEKDNRNYALVTGYTSNQLHLIDVTNPYRPVPVSVLADNDSLMLANPRDLDIFENNGRIYAIVTAATDDGVQIVDLGVSNVPEDLSDVILIPPPNSVPVANAGSDRTVASNSTVTLDGSGSSDSDGDPITYLWGRVSGPTVSLSNSNVSSPTFTAPTVTVRTSIVFSLTVNDGQVNSLSDTVNITVATPATSLPDRPQNLQSHVSNTTVTLTWDDPDDHSILGYKILTRHTNIQTPFYVFLNNTGSAENEYTISISDLDPSYAYVFRIAALNELGESQWSKPAGVGRVD